MLAPQTRRKMRAVTVAKRRDVGVPEVHMGSRSQGNEVLQLAIARNFDRSRRDASTLGAAAAALCAALGLFPSHRAEAGNTYFVNSTGDSGPGTLRQVIAGANAGDTVMFDAGLVGSTITLTSELYIKIDKPMYIKGPGANLLTISGGQKTRVFYVKTDTQADEVRISGLTLTAGKAGAYGGGAIAANNSLLELYDSAVTGSTAAVGGGVSVANSYLHVKSSRISGNTAGSTGGGISAADSSVTVLYSTISGNTAGTYGGGIYASNVPFNFSVYHSTISGNRIPQPAGAVSVGGGGIALKNSSALGEGVFSSTVAMNYAFQNGGGIALLDATSASLFLIVASTIASNSSAASSGNGIHSNGAGSVDRTIVSGNFSASGPSDLAGTFSLHGCLVQDPDSATITGASSGNLFGTDPQLSALADHGGPTLTLLPSASSPVLEVGPACQPGNGSDQRGNDYARCVGAKTDIGAVERQNPENIIFRNGLEPS